jgi:hypothetical protein
MPVNQQIFNSFPVKQFVVFHVYSSPSKKQFQSNMKNLLLLVILFTAVFSFGQTCVIDTGNTIYGVSPSPDSIPCVERGVPYQQAIQILVPPSFSGVDIDSFKVNNVSGIPAGLSYQCNPVRCVFKGNEKACVSFYGTTTVAAGSYDLGFSGTAYVKFNGIPTQYPLTEQNAAQAGFALRVDVIEPGAECRPAATGIAGTKGLNAHVKVYPNPAVDVLNVTISTASVLDGTIEIMDALGRTVASRAVFLNTAENITFNTSGYAKGMYAVVIKSNSRYVVKKFNVQ